MSKLSKLCFSILCIFSIFCITHTVYASDINMNLASNTMGNEVVSNSTTNHINSPSQTTTVNNNSNIPESGLGLSNVLNILLVTVGVILVFLGIAILIRLKH